MHLIPIVLQCRSDFADFSFDENSADKPEAATFGIDAFQSIDHKSEERKAKLFVA
jgi:hypothetical protein